MIVPFNVRWLAILIAIVASGLYLTAASHAQAQNLVANGDFETGIPPWTYTDFTDPLPSNASFAPGFGRNGTNAVIYRQRVTPGHISQPLNTVAGTTYRVSFWIAASSGSSIAPSLGATSTPTIIVPVTNSWSQHTVDIVAPTNGAALSFAVMTNGTSTYERIDDVSVVAVPPPPAPVPTLSEWAMILFATVLAGGAALLIQRRQAV